MRERRILSVSPGEILDIVQRHESHEQLQRYGAQVLGKPLVMRVVAHEGRIELSTAQPDLDGRLTQNSYVDIELRPHGHGSVVEFEGFTPTVALAAFVVIFALILSPVWIASPVIAAALWGVVALWCGGIAWASRRRMHSLNMAFMQVIWSATPLQPGQAQR